MSVVAGAAVLISGAPPRVNCDEHFQALQQQQRYLHEPSAALVRFVSWGTIKADTTAQKCFAASTATCRALAQHAPSNSTARTPSPPPLCPIIASCQLSPRSLRTPGLRNSGILRCGSAINPPSSQSHHPATRPRLRPQPSSAVATTRHHSSQVHPPTFSTYTTPPQP